MWADYYDMMRHVPGFSAASFSPPLADAAPLPDDVGEI